MHPTDQQLLQWKNPSEDHFVERKSCGDAKDWAKTVVAFANSAPHDRHGVLYVGVRDDGSVEDGNNLDSLQKTLRQRLESAYPPIEYTTRVLSDGGKPFLCVIVAGSPNRPHFAGPAFVRVGSQTVNASREQFDRLIAERNSKTHKILQQQGKTIRVDLIRSGREALILGRVASNQGWEVIDCTQHSVTFRDGYLKTHSFDARARQNYRGPHDSAQRDDRDPGRLALIGA